MSAKRLRFGRIASTLKTAYPEAHCELHYSNPLELLIATILSAQCTDKQVNLVTPSLFKKHRSAEDFASAKLADLEQDIKRLGLFRNKAKNIRACCAKLVECHQGDPPKTVKELTKLDGVGRKTANVLLGVAFNINEGIVVDTHVARLSRRLRLSANTTPEKIEKDLQGLAPKALWTILSHWLIWHGRRRCYARKPNCAECEIADNCPTRDAH